MEVRVLGGGDAGVPWSQAGCLLVDGCVALDSGGLVSQLDLGGQLAIEHVLISHAHLDHVGELAFLIENVMSRRVSPLSFWAPQPVLETLRAHLFNDEIWPDFSRIELRGFPVIRFCELPAGEATGVAHLSVRWERTRHPVFSAGYLVDDGRCSVLYTGDTGPTEAIWALGESAPGLQAIFTETSFPDRLRELAQTTGHLTPALLGGELAKLSDRNLPVNIMHVKPYYHDEIRAELAPLMQRCRILDGSERLQFPAGSR